MTRDVGMSLPNANKGRGRAAAEVNEQVGGFQQNVTDEAPDQWQETYCLCSCRRSV